jgi:predicted helicase
MGTVSHFNETAYAKRLIEKYKAGLGEKKLNSDDDYIKFLALGQNFIENNPKGSGILAYISNNSFLDGITHRQMRKVLLETFDKIYILNLHGNARKKEKTPDGSKDENVFNIMQGNSINIFIRSPSKKEGTLGKVFYADLYGKRQEKFGFLLKRRLKKTGYERLEPVEPYYFFMPKDFSLQKKYAKGFSITELFTLYNSGIQTDRDNLFIDHDKDILARRMQQLVSGDYDWRFEDDFRIVDSSGYKLTHAIKNKKYGSKYLQRIAYRPFDNRWIYYDPTIISRPGYKAMQHLLDLDNFCLIVSRQVKLEKWNHVFMASGIVERCVNFCGGGSGAPKIFPLYVYPPQEERRPNFNQEIVTKIEQIIGKKVKPEKLFDYIYAVLHSPKYRTEYEEFLKIDFPRIPYPKDAADFDRYVHVGSRLRKLHLMESVPKTKTTFSIADGNVVENVRFVGDKVFINKTQYFGNVPESAWTFFIGGYQPAQKYLKDRKGRKLSFDEIQHYQKIVAVLNETENIGCVQV